jgi:hypothetical protein
MKEFAHPDSKEVELADLNHAIENTLIMAHNEHTSVAELETDVGELPPVRCHIGELNQAAPCISPVRDHICESSRSDLMNHRVRALSLLWPLFASAAGLGACALDDHTDAQAESTARAETDGPAE